MLVAAAAHKCCGIHVQLQVTLHVWPLPPHDVGPLGRQLLLPDWGLQQRVAAEPPADVGLSLCSSGIHSMAGFCHVARSMQPGSQQAPAQL
eukprot:CAMPEP_0202918616 /NCGR_PEP_ID=MMETSP1392-20130828/73881_1 /ASSEMBLY_ACC=CAM_ASM_000868 /TAXON_ID=225041 /ORGANISM="Chlamydomonas chlamydogama, Strain SAG 11-48b" /LENGTH=90 /DNA_ID=CAMNT_0049611723 /DNA_START=1428 /DNA_END=1700 /DNA_ORIENTATION=+